MEALQLVKEFLFPGRTKSTAIPSLDGGLTPNDRLDALPVVAEVAEPDDVLVDGDDLYVTSGASVLRIAGGRAPEVVAALDGEAGAIAAVDGGYLVCVAGVGVVRFEVGGTPRVVVDSAGGSPLHCPTDLAVLPDDGFLVTDGSRKHHGPEWVRDLMERNAAGRLVRVDPSGRTEVLADGLAYPSGVALAPDGDTAVVSEAWAHRIRRFPLSGKGKREELRVNMPGYPGRINPAVGGGYWLSVFALRTQLVEFVLTQRDYAEEMMRTIEPDYWIRPALRGLNSGLEPLQGGQIRKLGVIKPWAPPRSYGLVARLDEDGYARESWHSRGGASRHGVTSARQFGDTVYLAVRGGDVVVREEVTGGE
jgi:strictosidine synthase-like protein